jgi:hypothetical protein
MSFDRNVRTELAQQKNTSLDLGPGLKVSCSDLLIEPSSKRHRVARAVDGKRKMCAAAAFKPLLHDRIMLAFSYAVCAAWT